MAVNPVILKLLKYIGASLVSQLVKNLPAMQDTRFQSLGWEDPLEEGMATHSSILAWRIPMDRGAWWATVLGVAKSRIWLSAFHLHLHLNILILPKYLGGICLPEDIWTSLGLHTSGRMVIDTRATSGRVAPTPHRGVPSSLGLSRSFQVYNNIFTSTYLLLWLS